MQLVLHNIGEVLTGRLDEPTLAAQEIVVDGGRIVSLDASAATAPDTVIDCKQMTVAPGLVDTHMHPTLGDYAPKQQSVGYLERMMHGAGDPGDLGGRGACAGPFGRGVGAGDRHGRVLVVRELPARGDEGARRGDAAGEGH